MSDERRKRRAWPWMILAIIALYVLSSGPAYGLTVRGYLDLRAYNKAYRPMWWLVGKSQRVLEAVEWYTELWEPEDSK